MFYKFDAKNSIHVPAPFHRFITPLFMADDTSVRDCPFSIHYTVWPPKGKVDAHSHKDATEAMLCVDGTGIAQIGGTNHEFEEGCMIVAGPGVDHYIENTGDKPLKVVCVFTPAITGAELRNRALAAVQATDEA